MPRERDKSTLYKIGQVAKMTGLQPFVLRFWEKEFKFRLPKAKSGHRYYRQEDIQKILQIKRLLYTEGFTIKGAMQKLHWGEAATVAETSVAQPSMRESTYKKTLQHLRSDVEALKRDLDSLANI